MSYHAWGEPWGPVDREFENIRQQQNKILTIEEEFALYKELTYAKINKLQKAVAHEHKRLERLGKRLSQCIDCLKHVDVDEYLANDMLCNTCAGKPEQWNLASERDAEEANASSSINHRAPARIS